MYKQPVAAGPGALWICIVVPLWLSLVTSSAAAADIERGKLLYENTCGVCHESTLHVRERRKARTFEQIQVQVVRWSTAAEAQWTLEEVEDVTDYLNSNYYRYPCAPEQCSFSPDKD